MHINNRSRTVDYCFTLYKYIIISTTSYQVKLSLLYILYIYFLFIYIIIIYLLLIIIYEYIKPYVKYYSILLLMNSNDLCKICYVYISN